MSQENFVTEQEVGRIEKNATSWVVARVMRMHGKRCGDVRVFARNNAGELVPTPAGVAIATERLPALAELVKKLAAAVPQSKEEE
jgi:hypothetical protein